LRAQALGGLIAPFLRYSQSHARVVTDYTFAPGHHLFGPFSAATDLSQARTRSLSAPHSWSTPLAA
jgi:hypothetical protein